VRTSGEEGLRLTDALDPARAEALAVVLGEMFDPEAPLRPFAHQVYFWDLAPEAGLGHDGHPKTGGLIPDFGLPRRMWAGGRILFHGPLLPGRKAEKRTVCESAVRKAGRSGPLAIVTLRHEIRQGGALRVTEWQDLVYRAALDAGAPRPTPPEAPEDEEAAEARVFTATTLLRYSALMMNGHRIHYDLGHAAAEGYSGLVVHGPLLAQHLLSMVEPPPARFAYRATSPLIAGERAEFCRKGARLWVRGADGRLCMTAEAETAG
jgi:3-methylfumaryl-CoA hydratase